MREVRPLPLAMVKHAPWNANKVSKRTLDKVRRSLRLFGSVENLVVRPGWCVGAKTVDELSARKLAAALDEDDWYECLSGNHRMDLYVESGLSEANAVVAELPDPQAKMLAQALNRLGGNDDPDKLKDLLKDVMETEKPADVAALLPHTETDLLKLISEGGDDETPELEEGPPVSEVGVIYELGPHRVLCGDSTNKVTVEDFLAGAVPKLMTTDPPYGVDLDQGWRDRVGGLTRAARGTAQDDRLANDDGIAWVPALGLVKHDIAYVWHADRFATFTEVVMEEFGYERRAQIIWRKPVPVIGRAHYHWQHEPCLYMTRKGATASWRGGRNQSTVWDAPSPRQIMGRASNAAEDAPEGHPTQKPVLVFERAIVNHLAVGEVVYDPFLGSGSCLIAAAKTDRVCYGVELNPKYVDLIRRRWTKWATESGRDPGPGALS